MPDRSLHEIEAELERDRAALARALDGLRERFSPAALIADGGTALASQARPLLGQVDRAIRSQPLAAAAAGIALAVLIFGTRRGPADPATLPVLSGTKFEALSRWEDEGGTAAAPPDPEEGWLAEAIGLRARADALLARIDAAARRGLAPAAELARHRAEILAALARDTRAALSRGLGTLNDAARDRAIAARERVYLGRIALRSGHDRTVRSHPFAAGAAMVAAGAALALLFRPTATEDRLLGEARDALLREAKAAAKDEMLKASALARGLADALGRDIDRFGGRPGHGSGDRPGGTPRPEGRDGRSGPGRMH